MLYLEEANCLLREQVESFKGLTSLGNQVAAAAEIIVVSIKKGGTVFFCGNGGSAADAQHLAAEFLGRFLHERDPISSFALTCNSSAVTAIGNDYGFEATFSRQLKGLARPGDVLVGLSTSGNSKNVVAAFEAAASMDVTTIALTGSKANALIEIANIPISVPSRHTPRIQEMHIAIGHSICEIVENQFLPKDS